VLILNPRVTIEKDGKVILRGHVRGNLGSGIMQNILNAMESRCFLEEVEEVTDDPGFPGHDKVVGTIQVKIGAWTATMARLRLVRAPETGKWVLPPHEIRRVARAMGIQMDDPPDYSWIGPVVVVLLLVLLLGTLTSEASNALDVPDSCVPSRLAVK
jgi:hypothetical protein